MDKLLEDKSRLIDDVILNEMDYLHRNIEKLQAYKSKSSKEINTLREVQKSTEHRMEGKFRDFEMMENTRIAEYVKSSLDKESHSRKVLDKKKRKTAISTATIASNNNNVPRVRKKSTADIKSSGYGYNMSSKENKQAHNVPKKEARVTTTNKNNAMKKEYKKNDIIATEISESLDEEDCDHVSDNNDDDTDNNDDTDETEHSGRGATLQQSKDLPPTTTPSNPIETKRSKLIIVNDRVKARKSSVAVVKPPPSSSSLQARDKKSPPYLVKNPRERMVDFR